MPHQPPPAETPGVTLPDQVVDEETLDSYRVLQDDGQPDVVTELIDVFLEDLPSRVESLGSAVHRAEPDELRAAAHALKGSAASIGAVRLAALCGALEAIGQAGATDGASALLEPVRVETERVTLALTQLRR